MTSTEELTASLNLRCEEMLAASPSTSGITHTKSIRRRSERIVLQTAATEKRLSSCPTQNRKRSSDDSRLNSPRTAGVNTLPDRAIMLDERVMINLRKAELNRQPSSTYLVSVQTELQNFHREHAVEWLGDVAREMHCQPDILPLAVNILDRYLSHQQVFPNDLQAIAGVCLFIASKLKAPTPINADNLVYFSSGAIEGSQVLSYEILILFTLNWDVAAPTPFDFYDQVIARLPHVSILRTSFIETLHGILRNYKLATLLPSIQCGIALLSAAKRYNKSFFSEIAGLFCTAGPCVPSILGIDSMMLHGIMSLADKTRQGDDGLTSIHGIRAPPSSNRTPSPQLHAAKAALLSTPINDSGFCSGASSPESVSKKDEMECSPPKSKKIGK